MNFANFDITIFHFINSGFTSPFLDYIMLFFTSSYQWLMIGILALLLFVEKEKKDILLALVIALVSFALADWAGATLKVFFHRIRPCNALEGVRLLVGCSKSFSMPSNHAANSFSLAIPFVIMAKSRLRFLMPLTAVFVAVSRVYVGVHYPSDVFAGALLGTMVAVGFTALFLRLFEKGDKRGFLILFLAGITFFRFYYILHGNLQLNPDEAHYWEWSRRLDINYYSKGPLIAYLIKTGTMLFGNTELGVRFFAPVLSALGSLFLFRLGTSLYDEETGFYSALLFQVIPLFSAFGIIMTIDAPFVFFWTVSLFLFHRALKFSSIREWLILGVALGLGMLAKYTMAFFFLSGFLYLLFSKEDRKELFTIRPYSALLVSALLLLPVLIWNLQYGWVNFKHNIGHAHINEGFVFSSKELMEFILSQAGVITPILFILIVFAVIRVWRKDKFSFWFAVPTLLFFLIKSAQSKVEANWAMAGYITGLIAFSSVFMKDIKNSKVITKFLLGTAIAISVFVCAAGLYPGILKLSPDLDPSSRLRGWRELASRVDKIRAEKGFTPAENGKTYFIFSDRYQVSSELAFYLKDQPVTYCANLGRRMNQYDLWPGFEGMKHLDAIFVRIDDSGELPPKIKDAFKSYEKKQFTVYEGQKILRAYSIYICYGFKGMEKNGFGSF